MTVTINISEDDDDGNGDDGDEDVGNDDDDKNAFDDDSFRLLYFISCVECVCLQIPLQFFVQYDSHVWTSNSPAHASDDDIQRTQTKSSTLSWLLPGRHVQLRTRWSGKIHFLEPIHPTELNQTQS